MSGPYAPTDLTHPATVTTAPPADWSVPEGTVAVAAEQAERPADLKSTLTDALQQDAAPLVWPDGSPELRPYLRLPFRARAEFMERLDPLWEKVQALPKGSQVGPKEAATMYRTMADVSDLLRGAAADPAVYDAWVEGVRDADFWALFNAYIGSSQPGEAAGSSS